MPGRVRVISGTHCCILDVMPPGTFQSKAHGWLEGEAAERWRLVVEVLDEDSSGAGPAGPGQERSDER